MAEKTRPDKSTERNVSRVNGPKPVPIKTYRSVALICKGLKPPPARVPNFMAKLEEVVSILAVSIKKILMPSERFWGKCTKRASCQLNW